MTILPTLPISIEIKHKTVENGIKDRHRSTRVKILGVRVWDVFLIMGMGSMMI